MTSTGPCFEHCGECIFNKHVVHKFYCELQSARYNSLYYSSLLANYKSSENPCGSIKWIALIKIKGY